MENLKFALDFKTKTFRNNAYQKQILLISPTNLIAALRMIAELWEHDKQNKNVLKIAEESGKLVDKFVGFLEDFDKVGEHLKKSDEIFAKARKKIKGGRGNLVDKIELINKLGAKAQKSIPKNYLELEN
jgi:DNA recombination protein RmuC